MSSKKLRFRLGIIFVLLGILFTSVVFWRRSSPIPFASNKTALPSPVSQKLSVYIPSRASLPGQPAIKPIVLPISNNPADRSPIADKLNLSTESALTDLTIVRDLLEEYRRAYGAFPVGEDNSQILNALSGNNPRKLVFIARNHSALSSSGALLDRWATPYFFHIQSSQEVEIRSAGPDREFYTSDDLLHSLP